MSKYILKMKKYFKMTMKWNLPILNLHEKDHIFFYDFDIMKDTRKP